MALPFGTRKRGSFLSSPFYNQNTVKAYWSLNGNSLDNSGNGKNGTDTAVRYPIGKNIQSAFFDGTTSKINVPNAINGTGNFTIIANIRLTSSADMPIYTQRATATGNGIIKFGISTGKIYFWDYNGSAFQFSAGNFSNKAVNDDVYHLVGFTRVGTAGKNWVDGVLDSSFTALSNLSWNTDVGTIGNGGAGSPTEFYSGYIDELVILSEAWTTKQWADYYAWQRRKSTYTIFNKVGIVSGIVEILTETVTSTDTFIKSIVRTLTETVTNSDTFTGLKVSIKILTETITNTDTIIRSVVRNLTETVTNSDTLIKKTIRSFAETVTSIDSILTQLVHGLRTIVLTEKLTVVEDFRIFLNAQVARWKDKYISKSNAYSSKYDETKTNDWIPKDNIN